MEARTWALALAAVSVVVFASPGGCYTELRKNLVWLPAECQPYVDSSLVPEIKPYRHCYRSCMSCMPSHALTTCSAKMAMHYSLNEYDMDSMRYIAGSCRGGYCCAPCHVHCLPYWRSFIPLEITIPYADEPGFYRDERQSVVAARQGLDDLLKVNATTAEYEKAKKAAGASAIEGAAGFYELEDDYHLPVYDAADQGGDGGGGAAALYSPNDDLLERYRRVATVVYEHRASRGNALAKLQEPHFAPGVVSECWYEPDWDALSPFIPQDHLAFAHEMGFTLWLWLVLLLTLVGALTCAYMGYVDPEPACVVACGGPCGGTLTCACLGAFKRSAAAARAKALASGIFGREVGSTPAGNYVGLYWQYGTAHVIPAQQIAATATSDTAGVFAGNGMDDVGSFELAGEFDGALLTLRKQYIRGTGNPRENLGHIVQIELTYCELMAALPERASELQAWGCPLGTIGFYGVWHVAVPGFEDIGEMVLWLPPAPVVIGYRIVSPETVKVEEQEQVPYSDAAAGGATMSMGKDGYSQLLSS